MPWTDWQRRKIDYNPQRQLRRLQSDLRDWRNPDHYKGFTQEQRDEHIAILLSQIAAKKAEIKEIASETSVQEVAA